MLNKIPISRKTLDLVLEVLSEHEMCDLVGYSNDTIYNLQETLETEMGLIPEGPEE